MTSPAVAYAVESIDGCDAVVARWDFSQHGGSFGEAEADAFVAATDLAIARQLPLVTMIQTGGTRLTDGMRALVGIPRTTLALQRLRAARLAHVSVAGPPTMGGVWVSVGSHADVRIAVSGGLVGFSGPRAVAAMTGHTLAAGANTAEAAYAAALVDALVDPDDVPSEVGRALRALLPDQPEPVAAPATPGPAPCDGWDQVVASRRDQRPTGRQLIDDLLSDRVPLRAVDDTVVASLGRLLGRRVIVAAVAADRSVMPTPAGFGLLRRAAELAGGLDLGLVCLVDTPGADPHLESAGLSPAIAEAMTAVLGADAPTVSVVHGEGGSGGALAAAVTDLVGVGCYGWFAALSPEGAAATLRIEPPEAARVMRITPTDLLADGFADAAVPAGVEREWLASSIDRLRELPSSHRQALRQQRWSGLLRPR